MEQRSLLLLLSAGLVLEPRQLLVLEPRRLVLGPRRLVLEPRLQPERLRQLVRQAPLGHSRTLAGPVHTQVLLIPFAARNGAS